MDPAVLAYFSTVTAVAAVGVVILQQILKLKFVPVSFANKYPVPTNIALSVIASTIAVFVAKPVAPTDWLGWLLLAVFISVVAGIIYNTTLNNWKELRETEGPAE